MIIISILIFIHAIIWEKYKNLRKDLIVNTFFLLFFSLILLLLLTFELKLYGTENADYGSDANYYWNAFLNVLDGISPNNFLAPNYVRWGAFVLFLSIDKSIIWVKLSNILLYSLSTNLLMVIFYNRMSSVFKKGSNILFTFFALNGIIIWTVIRNLKETFFLFIIISEIYLLDILLRKRIVNYIKILLFLIFIYFYFILLNGLRPMGGLFSFFIFLGVYLNKNNQLAFNSKNQLNKNTIILLIIFILLFIFYFIYSKFTLILSFQKLFMEKDILASETSEKFNIFSYPIYILRFLLGPGPFRSLRQLLYKDIFLVSTRVGDMLIFIGSFIWWLELVFVLYKTIKNINLLRNWKYFYDFLFLCITITIAYSFIGGGTGDTRLRSMIYFLSMPLAISLLEGREASKI
jgi:hypothetical protein